MKVLVLAAMYPTIDGKRPLYYIHSRNLYYKEKGIEVTALNFACSNSYIIDGIRVIGLSDYKKSCENFDLLICHAANLRNHYRFLMKYQDRFSKIMFVFHGHEILHVNKYYPKPYYFSKRRKIPFWAQNAYDSFKIHLWKKYIRKNLDKVWLVFVSQWIFSQFIKETQIKVEEITGHYAVISNSIGKFFENNMYCPKNIKYDFISIRVNMDVSKYGVDIIIKMAEQNPEYKFLLIGKGEFFSHYKKPQNVDWINKELSHEEMAQYINSSRIALLPTREDTQGLIACEMASFGIPLITSDIEVCREVFEKCPKVSFINNDCPNLKEAVNNLDLDSGISKWTEYYSVNTVDKETELIIRLNEQK